jgi:protein-disulfide isomerase
MTGDLGSDDHSGAPSHSAPVTVVGYPDHPPVSSAQSIPGLAGVKMTVSSLRVLAVVTLLLLLLVAAVSIVGVVSLRGQVSTLSEQVAELSEQVAVQAAPALVTDEAQDAAGDPAQAAQLPAAPQLPEDSPFPAGVDGSGAVLIGDPSASNVVEVYVDYQCPYCQRWEQQVGEALASTALDPASDVLIKQYNLAFLGETSPALDPPGSSARAANASLCVLEGEGPATFADFNTRLFAIADPNRSSVQFQLADLVQVARDSGGSDETVACIEEERHVDFVALSTQSGFARGVQGTPTVIVNGRTLVDTFSDTELVGLLR